APGHDRAAPDREILLDRPHLLARDRIPRAELAAISAGTRAHLGVGADVRRAGDIAGLGNEGVLAEILMWDIEQLRPWRPGARLPVLGARRRGADIAQHRADSRIFLRVVLQRAARKV